MFVVIFNWQGKPADWEAVGPFENTKVAREFAVKQYNLGAPRWVIVPLGRPY